LFPTLDQPLSLVFETLVVLDRFPCGSLGGGDRAAHNPQELGLAIRG
jgi:hypothetical protein